MSTGATGPSGSNSSTSTQNASSATGGTGRTGPTGNIKESTLTSDIYGVFVGAFFVVLSLIVLFTTNSFIAVLVLWATIALVLAVLVYYDFVSIDQLFGSEIVEEKEKKKEVVPATPGTRPNVPLAGAIIGSEVFHIYDQVFTYDEAPAVCGAYGAELATLEQIMEAYSKGAEWCGYGWSVGGMALYPTQLETWKRLQQEVDPGKRTFCGRPGVNGGYFDPATKFGVNCFGFKPAGEFTPPGPVPGVDMTKYNSMVERFKRMLKTLTLDPYSRNEWSKYKKQSSVEKFVGRSSFTNPFKQSFFTPFGVREHLEGGDDYVESLGGSLGNNARSWEGPYGIRGGKGETGPSGLKGDQGDPGTPGAVGPGGPIGPSGERGHMGPTGEKGEQGEQGIQGTAGAAGSTVGVVGPVGATGATGEKGERGFTGADGKNGTNGAAGAAGAAGLRGPEGPAGPATQATIPRNLNVDSIDIGGVRINQRADQPRTLQFSTPGSGNDAGFLFDMQGEGSADWSTMWIRRGDYQKRQ
jgi:hypothetical protein